MAFGLSQQWAGRLDRRVKLLRATVTYNAMNEPVETFTHVATVFANVNYMRDLEKYDSDAVRAEKMAKFVIRWRTDINEKDRVEYDGKTYKIRGVTEMGRREMLELLTEYTEGNA